MVLDLVPDVPDRKFVCRHGETLVPDLVVFKHLLLLLKDILKEVQAAVFVLRQP